MLTMTGETGESSRWRAGLNKADEHWKPQHIIWLNALNLDKIENGILVDNDIFLCGKSENIICAVIMNIIMPVFIKWKDCVKNEER